MALTRKSKLLISVALFLVILGSVGLYLYKTPDELKLTIRINSSLASNQKVTNMLTGESMSLDDQGCIVFKDKAVTEIAFNDGEFDWTIDIPEKGDLIVDFTEGKMESLLIVKEVYLQWGFIPMSRERHKRACEIQSTVHEDGPFFVQEVLEEL